MENYYQCCQKKTPDVFNKYLLGIWKGNHIYYIKFDKGSKILNNIY